MRAYINKECEEMKPNATLIMSIVNPGRGKKNPIQGDAEIRIPCKYWGNPDWDKEQDLSEDEATTDKD